MTHVVGAQLRASITPQLCVRRAHTCTLAHLCSPCAPWFIPVMAQSRSRRFTVTYNNNPLCIDYLSYISQFSWVKRAVFGAERSQNDTRHIQGYLETHHPTRLSRLQQIFPAHWEVARGPALNNFRYCIKENVLVLYGDWGDCQGDKRANSSSKVRCLALIRGLYQDPYCDYRYDWMYIRNRTSIDLALVELNNLEVRNRNFIELAPSLLRKWQYDCIIHVYSQPRRKICWYYETSGGAGKTFLSQIMYYLLNYEYFDGITNCRDIALLMSAKPVGFVFDITRKDSSLVAYQTLESCKNGFLMSGKYQGIKRIFRPVPVVVFANVPPEEGSLSEDRVCLHHIEDEGQTCEAPSYPVPSPFVPPPSFPWISEEDESSQL